ncbi:MAG TPA: single-stranded DNA-binding protein [Allocoleopsis sp.]
MNNFVLMAEIVQNPQLRYTPDTQVAVAEMMVEFPGIREEDPPAQLRVLGWGNLAQEIQEKYHQGDRVIIEGRLNINNFDRPEGFKEKRAELTAQKIHLMGAGATLSTSAVTPAATTPTATPATPATPAAKTTRPPAAKPAAAPAKTPVATPAAPDPVDYDDIPF